MLINLIIRYTGYDSVIYQGDGADQRNYKVDFSKVKQVLNFTPKFSIEKGIQEILKEIKRGTFHDFEKNKFNYGNYEIQ